MPSKKCLPVQFNFHYDRVVHPHERSVLRLGSLRIALRFCEDCKLGHIQFRPWRYLRWVSINSLICGLLIGCTVLETTPSPSARFDEARPHVGRYYFLPKALITIEGAPDTDGNYLVTTSVSLVADKRYKYFLNWKPNAFSEDAINNLDVDSDGLLTSVNYSAEDKTPAIISDIVKTAINVFKIAGQLRGNRAEEAPRAPFKYTFDPFNEYETHKVRYELRHKQSISVYVYPDPAEVHHLKQAADPAGGGVFYHPPTPIELLIVDNNIPQKKKPPNPSPPASGRADTGGTPKVSPSPSPVADASTSKPKGNTAPEDVKSKSATGSPANRSRVVMTVPDLDNIVCFRLGRAFMTKRETNLTFVHGMPEKLVFKQPSVVQAVTGMLSSVTSTIGEAVPTLIKVSDDRKIAALQEQTSLVTEQSKLLEAQKKLIEDQQALAKAKSGSHGSDNSGDNRSDSSEMPDLRSALQRQAIDITQLQERIRKQKQDIKTKLQASGLSAEEIRKVIEAAELDKDDE